MKLPNKIMYVNCLHASLTNKSNNNNNNNDTNKSVNLIDDSLFVIKRVCIYEETIASLTIVQFGYRKNTHHYQFFFIYDC